MSTWQIIPKSVPTNGQQVSIRVFNYFSAPFLAVYNSTTQQFTSVVNSIIFPIWTVTRWLAAVVTSLIQNGNFTDGSFWSFGTGWSLGSGVASYSASGNGTLSQTLSLPGSGSYTLSFAISNCAYLTAFTIVNQAGNYLFDGDLDATLFLADGTYSYTVNNIAAGTSFQIRATTVGYAFDITNIVLEASA